ncbi:MAG: hypothetical protein K8T10_13140 [Candidatus Eremiobacteraeota bacterium]|nr:hypothetical protein [Candidatus Eremiobacteraeota bacterium]
MRKYFHFIIITIVVYLAFTLIIAGCGGGGGTGGSYSAGDAQIRVEYPQDRSGRQEKSPTPAPTSTASPIPPPDFISFYLIDIRDPATGMNLVETTRIDYPASSASIGEIPVGPVQVIVAGFDQYNYLRTYGISNTEIVENQNTAVEVITTPVSPSPLPSPSQTPSPTPTYTPTPTPTYTPTPTPTATYTPTPTPTATYTPTPTPTTPGYGVMYVSNKLGDNITVYNHASKAIFNTPPNRTIERAGANPLNDPRDATMDPSSRDLLYVSDQGGTDNTEQVVVFNNAHTANGSLSAFHTFYSNGAIRSMNGIWGMYLDEGGDKLYTLNYNSGAKPFVLVFNNASTKQGEVDPDKVFILNISPPTKAKYMFVDMQTDGAHHTAYITDDFNSAIYAIDDINNQTPGAPYSYDPDRTITAQGLGELDGCNGIFVHNNTIYTACGSNKSVTILSNASTLSGAVASKAVIKGANTTFVHPVAVALDPSIDTLYVTDYEELGDGRGPTGRILVFRNVSTLSGTVNIAPHYILSGASTGLNAPYGLFVDVLRNE